MGRVFQGIEHGRKTAEIVDGFQIGGAAYGGFLRFPVRTNNNNGFGWLQSLRESHQRRASRTGSEGKGRRPVGDEEGGSFGRHGDYSIGFMAYSLGRLAAVRVSHTSL